MRCIQTRRPWRPSVAFVVSFVIVSFALAQPPAGKEASKVVASFKYSPDALAPIFDEFWKIMDRHYSYFFLKPQVDWTKLKENHRAKALAARDEAEFVAVMKAMLEPLNDIHVFIVTSEGKRIETGSRTWNFNGNSRVSKDQIEGGKAFGRFAVLARTKGDGFGYFWMVNQGAATPALVEEACKSIREMKDAPGFIVDLRRASGGSEPLAMEIAKLFCAEPVVYAKSKYRNGPGHVEFGPDNARTLPAAPAGEAFTKPVVCLIGEGCISSGEGFAKMMRALPHCTLVGLPSAGASGNPRPVKLGGTGAQVYFSRWVDMLPDGTVTEGKGVPPAVEVKVAWEVYQSDDPTVKKGLELLRQKTNVVK